MLHFHRNIDKFRACLANYLLFFSLKLQKTQEYLEAKFQRFRDVRYCCALRRQSRKILAIVLIEKACFFAFAILYDAAIKKQQKKRLLNLTEHSELSNFTNTVAKLTLMLSNLRINEAENWQKITNSQPQLKIYWFY